MIASGAQETPDATLRVVSTYFTAPASASFFASVYTQYSYITRF